MAQYKYRDTDFYVKRFHISDTLTYEYKVVQLPLSENSEYKLHQEIEYLYASPSVTWKDIFDEYKAKTECVWTEPVQKPFLSHCTVTNEQFVIALSVSGFSKVVQSMPMYGHCTYDELVEDLAKQLITHRDYEGYRRITPFEERTLKFKDFWPKD